MSPPTKELMKLTLEKKIAHGGQPVLRWMMDNIFIKRDPARNNQSRIKKNPQRRLTMQFSVDICPISQFMI